MENNIFGRVDSPAPIGSNPTTDLGNLIGVIIALVFTVAGIVALVYMLWGALNWITSGGDKEKLMKAQGRIRNAVIGIFVLIIVFALFGLIFQVILGGSIISVQNGAIQFKLPTLNTENDGSISCPAGCVARSGVCTCPGSLPP
ncbi:hypothetical protein HYS00_05535 [Candidatus Microgenomates bacterium]|nr:hypothetical protein [Candidatus Microgenomates bacterium]